MARLLPFLCTALLLFNSCTQVPESNGKLKIVTTTGIIADCIQKVVGEQAEVISIMGPGVDPHLYKASQGDMVKLGQADVVVYNGLHLEGKMAKVLEQSAKDRLVISMSEFMDQDRFKRVDASSELRDPHIWFDPDLWLQGLKGVVQTLEEQTELDSISRRYKSYDIKVRSSLHPYERAA